MAASIYKYQSVTELRNLDATFVASTVANDPMLGMMFPLQSVNTHFIRFRQRDAFRGLMQARGFGERYPVVARVGENEFLFKPSSYGEHVAIDEEELTIRATPDSVASAMDITDLVSEADEMLQARQANRVRHNLWTLILEGVYTVTNKRKAVVGSDSVTIARYAGSDWSTAASATPIADFRAVGLLAEGTSAAFGPTAKAFMNQRTANNLLAVTNAADLGGYKVDGGGRLIGMADINRIFAGEGLPQIVVYHDGYLNDAGTFATWIPDDVVVIVGTFNGQQRLGQYTLTRHAKNPGRGPGFYVGVKDTTGDPNTDEAEIAVRRGFNGGPELWYGGAVVAMTC